VEGTGVPYTLLTYVLNLKVFTISTPKALSVRASYQQHTANKACQNFSNLNPHNKLDLISVQGRRERELEKFATFFGIIQLASFEE